MELLFSHFGDSHSPRPPHRFGFFVSIFPSIFSLAPMVFFLSHFTVFPPLVDYKWQYNFHFRNFTFSSPYTIERVPKYNKKMDKNKFRTSERGKKSTWSSAEHEWDTTTTKHCEGTHNPILHAHVRVILPFSRCDGDWCELVASELDERFSLSLSLLLLLTWFWETNWSLSCAMHVCQENPMENALELFLIELRENGYLCTCDGVIDR